MEFTNLYELYQAVLPAFDVKQRILSISPYYYLTNKDIWNYLSVNKWKKSYNLGIADIVNDIIMIDENLIINGGDF